MDRLAELERRLERVERQLFPMEHPPQPFMPTVLGPVSYQCIKCGMKSEGPMGYVCPRSDCPTQPKAVS